MSVAAVLAIVVAVGEAGSTTSAALMAAAQESIGTSTTIRMVEVASPTRAAGLSVERALGASSVVVVSWREPAHLHALLLHHVATTDRWTRRQMAFARADALYERGRTLGLAVASMSPESGRAAEAPASAPASGPAPPPASRPSPPLSPARPTSSLPVAPVPELVAAPAATPTPTATPTPAPLQPAPEPPTARSDESAVRPNEPAVATNTVVSARTPAVSGSNRPDVGTRPRARSFGLGLAASGASGLGNGPGGGFGFGGTVDGVIYLRPRLGLHLGLTARRTAIPELPGQELMAAAALGLEWWAIGGARDRGWGVGLRLDALALYHRVSASSPTQPSTDWGFEPAADAFVEAYLALGRRFDLVVGVGLEVANGSTPVHVRQPDAQSLADQDQLRATIPATRAMAFAGLRVGW